jgi:hypothetical protein
MKKNLNRLATLALSGMMVLSTAAPVFATSTNVNKTDPNLNVYFNKDESNAGKNVNGSGKLEALGNSISFDKVIRIDLEDNQMVDMPDVYWEYTIEPVADEVTINTGTAKSAPYKAGTTKIVDEKNNEIVVLPGKEAQIDKSEAASDLKAEFKPSKFTLDTTGGPKDFSDGVKITFKPEKFDDPGVYRFVVTESAKQGPNAEDVDEMDVTVDNTTQPYQKQRFLDVYVRVKEGTVNTKEIYGYVLHSGDTSFEANKTGNKKTGNKNSGYDGDKEKGGKKDTPQGYTKYKPRKLRVDKKISGMINKDNAFPFELNLYHNRTASEKTDNSDLQVKVKLPGASGYTIKQISEIPGLGAALSNGQFLEIIGLPRTTTFDVKEQNNTQLAIKSDVRFSTDVNTAVPEDNAHPVESETVRSGAESTARGIDKNLKNDNAHFAYHNHIDEITPTGVVLTVAPYAMMLAVAGSMGFMFFNRKKEEE